jgi:hypothetical protein
MATVHTEIWTGEVLRKFRKDGSFLATIPDRSNLVKNKVIHLVDLGADPAVLINNTTYPIGVVDANDADIPISLDKFDTENTAITDDYLYAISFDVIGEYSLQHVESLQESTADKAIHALAPQSNSAATPIILTTGNTDGGTSARKKITKNDIIALKKAFDIARIPKRGRVLVLCPEHVAQILEFDEQFAMQYMNIREGEVLRLYGFDIYEYTDTPKYDASNVKKPYAAAAAPSTDRYASVAFYAPRMFKAMDKPEMYYKIGKEDPQFRQNTIGFRHYFVCLPKKQEAIGAIVSVPI